MGVRVQAVLEKVSIATGSGTVDLCFWTIDLQHVGWGAAFLVTPIPMAFTATACPSLLHIHCLTLSMCAQGVLADVSIATGSVTIGLMLTGRFVFQYLGWGAAAIATPIVMALSGTAFFGMSLAAQFGVASHVGPYSLAAAGVMAGAVTQVACNTRLGASECTSNPSRGGEGEGRGPRREGREKGPQLLVVVAAIYSKCVSDLTK